MKLLPTPLYKLVRQLYAARWRKNTGPVFVEFTSAGKVHRVEVTSPLDKISILGTLWLRSHCESQDEQLRKRRVRYSKHLK